MSAGAGIAARSSASSHSVRSSTTGGYRSALGFLAALPLLWAALRCDQRDTATTALILSGFAVWGTLAGGGPFAGATSDDSFLPLIMFMIGTSVLEPRAERGRGGA